MSKSIFKNSIYKMILNIFNLFVPLLVMPHISSLLNSEDFAAYNTAFSYFSFFLIFAVFGIYNYGVREISRIRDDKPALERLFTNLFVFGIITSGITSLAYFIFVKLTVVSAYQLLYYVMIIQIAGNILSIEWMNEAVENYGFITLKTVIVRSLFVFAIFFFVRKESDVVIYAIIMSISVLLNNIISYFYVKRKLKFRFDDFHLGKYVKPLFILLLISNVNYLYTQLDRVFISQFIPGVAITEYTMPCNIINMIGVMLISLIMVSVPRLSYYVAHGMETDYLALLNKSSRTFFLVLCPACIGLCCLSYEAMYLYTGGKYAYAHQVLEVFALRFLISSLYSIFTNQILYIRGRERTMVKIIAVGGGLNLLFDIALALTKTLNPITAIASTAVAETVMLSIMYWFIRKRMKVNFHVFAFSNMKYLYFSLPFFPIAWAVHSSKLSVLLNCAIIIPLCAIFYLLMLIITKDDMLVYLLKKLKLKK